MKLLKDAIYSYESTLSKIIFFHISLWTEIFNLNIVLGLVLVELNGFKYFPTKIYSKNFYFCKKILPYSPIIMLFERFKCLGVNLAGQLFNKYLS